MNIKSSGRLQRKMTHYARGLLVLVVLFLIFLSIWTPLLSEKIFHRWYSIPNVFLLSPLPLLTMVALYKIWKNLGTTNQYKPILFSIVVFMCAYISFSY